VIAEDTTEVSYEDVMLSIGDEIIIRWSPNSIVPQPLQEHILGTQTFSVDISFYMIDPDAENVSLVAKLATNVPNTGMYQLTLQEMDIIEDYTSGTIGVTISEQLDTRNKRGITAVLKTVGRAAVKYGPPAILRTAVTVVAFRALCEVWAGFQGNVGEEILSRLPPCPPTRRQALKDDNFDEESFSFVFHPNAASCFKQRDFTPYVYLYRNR